MRDLKRRLSMLEQSRDVGMHCILRYSDQTQAEALAAYEAVRGPAGDPAFGMMHVYINKPLLVPVTIG